MKRLTICPQCGKEMSEEDSHERLPVTRIDGRGNIMSFGTQHRFVCYGCRCEFTNDRVIAEGLGLDVPDPDQDLAEWRRNQRFSGHYPIADMWPT